MAVHLPNELTAFQAKKWTGQSAAEGGGRTKKKKKKGQKGTLGLKRRQRWVEMKKRTRPGLDVSPAVHQGMGVIPIQKGGETNSWPRRAQGKKKA